MANKISTQPYKGTRDFYPEQMRVRQFVFNKLSEIVEKYGYEPYDGPVLESFDLYAAKTGEEIVNEQLYSFEDRGGRKVAIRPEMTPTLARMVAKKSRELAKPIRWYSIPNLWRYENPQKGRLREHWQLNVDVFGIKGAEAEAEILALAIDILLEFKADSSMFELRYNHRSITDVLLREILLLKEEPLYRVSKIIDKKAKISPEEFQESLIKEKLSAEQVEVLQNFFKTSLSDLAKEFPALSFATEELLKTVKLLESFGYGEYIKFYPEIMRGFDYYTGLVFEVYDKNPENRRSIYGGGRYDNLLDLFGTESMSGIGFGMGDVTFFDFLHTHKLLEEKIDKNLISIALFPDTPLDRIWSVARSLRQSGIGVDLPWDITKFGKQLQAAEKKGIRFVLILGAEELAKNSAIIKDLNSGEQSEVSLHDLSASLTKKLNL